ncbi:hypothetical protein BC943DRAFT_362155 [Umbelopsis sp. AD052]|nr:hypothetical protein BC943DRAFT_362155 [Umbelopsis sp. AD052]
MPTQELGPIQINSSGWPAMDSGISRYQLTSPPESVISKPSAIISTSTANDSEEWNPYNVPWDTKRTSTSRATAKQNPAATLNANPNIDSRVLVHDDEWYCDSGSSSSSTSSNDRSTPRRSSTSTMPLDDRARQSDNSWRMRSSTVDDTIAHKRNKKSTLTKKHTQSKDVSTPRNKIAQHQTKDEERVMRTDEIALFMRCKKRACDAEVQPIPPAPGGWDDVVPDRTISWGELKARSTTSDRSPHSVSGKRSENSQTLREDKNKANSRHDFAHHGGRQVSYSKSKPTTKLNNMEGPDMASWGKPMHISEVSQPWREKLTSQPPAKKNDIPSSYYNIPLPMENTSKHAIGHMYPSSTKANHQDMNASHSYTRIGDTHRNSPSPIDTLRYWHYEKEGHHASNYNNEDSPLSPSPNEMQWQTKETFTSPWDPQPKAFTNPRQNPPSWKERKGSLDSLRMPNPHNAYNPAPSTENVYHGHNQWSPMLSIWSMAPEESHRVRPSSRRSSFDVGNPVAQSGQQHADWSQSGGLDDWMTMNKRVGSLMRLLEEDVTPVPTRTNPLTSNTQAHMPCHANVDHLRDYRQDSYPGPQPPCSHCGASNRVMPSAMRNNTYM